MSEDLAQAQRDLISAYQDALISMFVQAGVVLDNGEIDTGQISVSGYEEAFDLLKRAGRVVEKRVQRQLGRTRRGWFFTNAEFCGAASGPDSGHDG